MPCRVPDATSLLLEAKEALQGLICQQQIMGSDVQAQVEVCRVMLWFVRRARARNDVQAASQVLADLDDVLAVHAANNSFVTMLFNRLLSLDALGGAVVGVAVTLLCSSLHVLLFLVVLLCVLVYWLNATKHNW